MHRLKKPLLFLLLVFVAIQFIQPARNVSVKAKPGAMINQLVVPANVEAIFKRSCYDCHSNNTRYPRYSFVQPIGWLLASHIKNARAEFNFDEYGNYTQRRKLSKLKAIGNSVKDGSMPLSSYTLLHPEARLSEADKTLIINWATLAKDNATPTTSVK